LPGVDQTPRASLHRRRLACADLAAAELQPPRARAQSPVIARSIEVDEVVGGALARVGGR
jgi:hypothetical protein